MGIVEQLAELVNQVQEQNCDYHAYTEQEQFCLDGKPLFSVIDFWRFQFAQLAGLNSEIAEFIVAKALSVNKSENSNYWSAYDMSYQGHRIEVKETSYIHPWNKSKVSSIRRFSIAPTNNEYWSHAIRLDGDEKVSRQSDIYVFCLNTNKDPQKTQPLNLNFWEFYVVPTYKINHMTASNHNPNQKTISLKMVSKLATRACRYDALKSVIDATIQDVDTYYRTMYDKIESEF